MHENTMHSLWHFLQECKELNYGYDIIQQTVIILTSALYVFAEFKNRILETYKMWPDICFKNVLFIVGVALYWPSGTYGLPKPISGCPENWTEGWRKQDLEDDRFQKSSFSSSFHMDAILNNDYINRSFCIKTRNEIRRHITWPAGKT